MTCLLLVLAFWGDDPYGPPIPLKIQPFDFQDEENPDTFIKNVRQVVSSGNDLYVIPFEDPVILQIKTDGSFVRRIGRGGQGPGEFGNYAPRSIAVDGPSLWALHSNGQRLFYFEKGEHVLDFRREHFQIAGAHSVFSIAFNQEHVVAQVFPGTRHLAAVYRFGGEKVRYLGDILPIEPKFLEVNPALNDTMWEWDGEHWYCLFVHRPILRKYGKDWSLVAEFQPMGPDIEAFEEKYAEAKKDPMWTYPKPHFRDFDVHGDHVYLMNEGTLYQVDKHTGKTLSRMIFHGRGVPTVNPDYADKLYFETFTILDSGTIVLADIYAILEHDLFKAQLPATSKSGVRPGR